MSSRGLYWCRTFSFVRQTEPCLFQLLSALVLQQRAKERMFLLQGAVRPLLMELFLPFWKHFLQWYFPFSAVVKSLVSVRDAIWSEHRRKAGRPAWSGLLDPVTITVGLSYSLETNPEKWRDFLGSASRSTRGQQANSAETSPEKNPFCFCQSPPPPVGSRTDSCRAERAVCLAQQAPGFSGSARCPARFSDWGVSSWFPLRQHWGLGSLLNSQILSKHLL